MRSSHLLFSVVHLILALVVVFLGVGMIGLYYMVDLREVIASLLYDHPLFFISTGVPFVLVGVVLLMGVYFMNRGRYYQLQMGTSRASIDQAIIREYVKRYWQELFPGNQFDVDVIIHSKQKLELIAQIPDSNRGDEMLMSRIQNELGVLLARKLGYEKDFLLTISEPV